MQIDTCTYLYIYIYIYTYTYIFPARIPRFVLDNRKVGKKQRRKGKEKEKEERKEKKRENWQSGENWQRKLDVEGINDVEHTRAGPETKRRGERGTKPRGEKEQWLSGG